MNQFMYTNPFDFFEKIYCINLDSRPDRWEYAQKEFEKTGIFDRVKRVSGVVYKGFQDTRRNACVGNHLSHALCIDESRTRGLENCLILEDDVMFINNTINVLDKAIGQLPPKWALFYLGVNTEKPCFQFSENLALLTFAFSTHAYAINSHMYDKLLEINTDTNILHNDVDYNNRIIPLYNCYVTIPLIAIQRPSYSNIEEQYKDYNWMEDRFKNNLVRRNVESKT